MWSTLEPNDHVLGTRNEQPQMSNIEANTEDDQQNGELFNLEHIFYNLVSLINPALYAVRADAIFPTLAKEFQAFDKQLPVLDGELDVDDPALYTVAKLQNITDSHITPRKPYPVWQHYLDVLFADMPDIKPAAYEKLLIQPGTVEFLSKLINFLSNQSPQHIELYIWKTVTQFLLYHPFNDLRTENDCLKSVRKLMGLAVTYTIADRNFLKDTKPRVEQMFNDIRSGFEQMVLESDWMDEPTKNAALEKSKAMKSQIGLPEWIMDVDKLEEHYRGLQIDPVHHFENWVNALQILSRAKLQQLQRDYRDTSVIDPRKVNAYYIRTANVINIPVGVIQFPFYYLGLEALNYGGLGFTVGHELTHGFSDSSRYYDKFGNFEEWMSNQTQEEYDDRASCLVEQYDSYYVPEAKGYVNGTHTLNENIVDNGAIREAFRAYQEYVKKNGPEPLLPGFEDFSHEQLFFISYGNSECASLSPDNAGEILNGRHSPQKFRVLGALSNMEEFSEAFQCPRGSKMNPEKKCQFW